MKSSLLSIALFSGLTIGSQAAVLTFTAVTGHNGGQTSGSPTEGTLITMIDGSGMDKTTNGTPDDPTTWINTNGWVTEWQSTSLLNSASTANSKIGWTVFDLGSVEANLENLYVFHETENNARHAATYNIYYASTPTVGLPAMPGEGGTSADVGATGGAGDYDFASGGWTQLGGTQSGTYRTLDTLSMSGLSARYIALEVITNGGDANRVGFSEVTITQIPEPSVALLSGFGVLMLLRRRKR